MKPIFIFLFTVMSLSCLSSYAQKDMDDVIHLKNGSKIKGTILQILPDSIVTIEQLGGSVWVFSVKDVSMIYKEEKFKFKALLTDAKGYRLGIDAGVLVGSDNNQNNAPLSLQMVHSYHFTPSTSAGVGVGLEFFHRTQAPVFLDLRHYFNRKYYAPYFFLQGGGMLPIGKEATDYNGLTYTGKTGFMVNSGMGFLFPLNEKTAFSMSFSYRYQELKFTRDNSSLPDYMRIEKMNRFNFRLGFILR